MFTEYSFFVSLQWQLLWLEIVLLVFSLCVAVILIFLSTIARLALKSNTSQVMFFFPIKILRK